MTYEVFEISTICDLMMTVLYLSCTFIYQIR